MFYNVFLLHCLILVCTKCLSGCMTLVQIIAVSTHIVIFFPLLKTKHEFKGHLQRVPKPKNYIASFNHDVKLPHKK